MGAVWRLQWRVARARRRLFLWNVAIPLALLAPVAVSPAAAPHRAAVYAVLVVLFGTFGSCIPLVREGRAGWTEKLLLTGYRPAAWLGERTACETALDALQLLPALGLLVVAQGGTAGAVLRLGAAVLLALLGANLLGAVAAGAVRSLAEGALASAAIGLLALHLAGTFRPPAPGGWQETAARWSPFRPLHEALLGLGGPPSAGAPASGGWGPSLAACALLLLLALPAAPLLGRRLAARAATD